MSALGSLVKGLVLAVLVAAVAGIGGALVATFFCGDACRFAEPAAQIMAEPAPALGGGFSMAALVSVLLFIGLFIVLAPREPVTSLAGIFALLIAAIGFLLWLPREAVGELIADPAPEPERLADPILEPRPVVDEIASCPVGEFLDGGACVPCTETIETAAPAALHFEPSSLSGSWSYASSSSIDVAGGAMSVDAFLAEAVEDDQICDASAILVIGSASSDGERTLNERRALTRANRLATAARKACGDDLDVYALSLGQSQAAADLAEDRTVSILKVSLGSAAAISGELIVEELGYTLSQGAPDHTVLTQREHFPRPWTGPEGEATAVREQPRPRVSTVVTNLGAPDECGVSNERAPTPVGLDGWGRLRQ